MERLVSAFVRFKLIALFEAHFEIVLALISFVHFDRFLIDASETTFTQTFFVFAHIVQFVTAHGKVRLILTAALTD